MLIRVFGATPKADSPNTPFDTHEVLNQSLVFGVVNTWEVDPPLQRITSALPADAKVGVSQYDAWLGATYMKELARRLPVFG